MTTEQVRDLLHDLLVWREAQTPGLGITALIETGAGRLKVTFADGTVKVIAVLEGETS